MMRLTIPFKECLPLGLLATVVRVFFGLAVDMPELYGGRWLAAMAGIVFMLPLFLWMEIIIKTGKPEPVWNKLRSYAGGAPARIFAGLLLAIMLFEAAGTSRILSNSAGYVSLENMPTWLIFLTLYIAVLYCVWKNGQSIGSAARVWLRMCPWLVLVVLLLQVRSFNINWIFPVLGQSKARFADGMLASAGWIAQWTAIWLLSEPTAADMQERRLFFKPLILTAAILLISLLSTAMLVAPGPHFSLSRALQIDALLSNGRVSLLTQFPMLILWFMGLLFCLCFYLFTASALLQRIFPKLDGCIAIFSTATAAAGIAFLRLAEQAQLILFSRYSFIINTGGAVLLGTVAYLRRERLEKCGQKCL